MIERKHVMDIALLTRKRQLNWNDFLVHCRQFRMQTIVYYSLLAAKEQMGGEIPEIVFNKLRPGWVRRYWLDRYLSPGTFPIYRFPKQNYVQIKIRLLFPLIDRISDWPRYLLRLGRVYGKSLWQGVKKKKGYG